VSAGQQPVIRDGRFVESVDAHRAVLDALHPGIVVFDQDGRVRMANRKADELFGVAPGELEGNRWDDPRFPVWDEAGEPLPAERLPAVVALRTGRPLEGLTVRSQRPDGTPLWISLSATPLAAQEGAAPYAVVVSMTDITRYKRTEEELARSNSDLGQFASVVAHDLSAPLAVIGGMADLLQRRSGDDLDGASRTMIGRISAAARSGQELIRELLAYAKAGEADLRREPVDLAEAASHTVDLLAGAADRVSIGPLPVVTGDPVQLGQLLQNLLGNALKFSDGPVEVTAERTGTEDVISVRDQGVGVPPEDAERIFGMLTRTRDAEGYPGTGIGLAVCRRIVERHGGRIWVESVHGKGSTFRVALPREI
jgi:PAS domain S-box-containing protein